MREVKRRNDGRNQYLHNRFVYALIVHLRQRENLKTNECVCWLMSFCRRGGLSGKRGHAQIAKVNDSAIKQNPPLLLSGNAPRARLGSALGNSSARVGRAHTRHLEVALACITCYLVRCIVVMHVIAIAPRCTRAGHSTYTRCDHDACVHVHGGVSAVI